MQAVDETQMAKAILRYQASLEPADAGRALELADPLIRGMLARSATVRIDYDDAYSRVRVKVWKSFRSYRAGEGRAFSFLNCVVQNCVRTLCAEQLRGVWSSVSADELDELPIDDYVNGEALEDLHHKLMQVRTICVRQNEIDAQRWLVNSLISSEFSLARHEAVRALRIAFAVDLRQGRLIHDRTVLELRRTLLNGRERFPRVNISVLRDKRERGLLRWKPYLCEAHFAKLVYLMHGLAPALLFDLIQAELRSLNGEGTPQRCREIIRQQLRCVLEGFPQSELLFKVIS